MFSRRFKNIDQSTCWLNSCLQLILNAFDYAEFEHNSFISELGREILRLQLSDDSQALDPTVVKNILSSTEDTRISLRLSEIEASGDDVNLKNTQRNGVLNTRFNLLAGQQCIRDLFMCLQVNHLSWPDIANNFIVSTTYSSVCCSCNGKVQHVKEEMYVELPVPPNNTNLNDHIEEYFNTGELVGRPCEDGCRRFVQGEARNQLTLGSQTKFLLVLLSRAMDSNEGGRINTNKTIATNDLFIR